MENLASVATASGALGVVICLLASAGRFYGEKEFVGFQAINIFIVGVGLMVLACWLKLEAKDHG